MKIIRATTVSLATVGGDKITVGYSLNGLLALTHRYKGDDLFDRSRWVITHLPSGCSVFNLAFPTLRLAVEALHEAADLGDWGKVRGKLVLDAGLKAGARDLQAALLRRGAQLARVVYPANVNVPAEEGTPR